MRLRGFDLLAKLKAIDFQVVFTTAHAEFAIQAIKFSALDYLLKPIDPEELKLAIAKVNPLHSVDSSNQILELLRSLNPSLAKSHETNKIAIPTSDGLVFVKIQDILYCEAMSNYTTFHMINDKKYIVSKTLKEYEKLLSEHSFFRIHNSYLINLQEIKKYIRGEGGYVVLSNDVCLDVSKRKKEMFMKKISFF